jgi:hypothetical protein
MRTMCWWVTEVDVVQKSRNYPFILDARQRFYSVRIYGDNRKSLACAWLS